MARSGAVQQTRMPVFFGAVPSIAVHPWAVGSHLLTCCAVGQICLSELYGVSVGEQQVSGRGEESLRMMPLLVNKMKSIFDVLLPKTLY